MAQTALGIPVGHEEHVQAQAAARARGGVPSAAPLAAVPRSAVRVVAHLLCRTPGARCFVRTLRLLLRSVGYAYAAPKLPGLAAPAVAAGSGRATRAPGDA